MTKPTLLPPQELLLELLNYCDKTGVFTWKPRARKRFASAKAYGIWNKRFAGKETGYKNKKSTHLHIQSKLYCAHRVAWKMMTGVEPAGQIDHKDGNPHNNRWDNLRLATNTQNCRNKKATMTKNGVPATSRYKGVGFYTKSNKWGARIHIKGKSVWLGLFTTEEEAHAAYCEAARVHFGEFARFA